MTASKLAKNPVTPNKIAAARIAGIISTKTSDNALITFCRGFSFLAAISFTSDKDIFSNLASFAKTL